ncbi:MAG: hypothetical protein JWN89_247 [Parcubacteria group bacterium]|nr:hypothetical protein [Parcubacteria group bacterium]
MQESSFDQRPILELTPSGPETPREEVPQMRPTVYDVAQLALPNLTEEVPIFTC